MRSCCVFVLLFVDFVVLLFIDVAGLVLIVLNIVSFGLTFAGCLFACL